MDINKPMATSSLPRSLKIAARSQIAPFIAMDVLARANARGCGGRDIIHLEVGEPGGGAPARVLDAARRALGRTDRSATPRPWAAPRCAPRSPSTTAAATVSRSIPSRSWSPSGRPGAFVLSFLAMFDPGDRVIVPEPAFPAYKNILQALGIEVVRIGLGPESDFKPTVAMLEAVPPPIHGLIVASPANPTGTMLDRSELAALATCCRSRAASA